MSANNSRHEDSFDKMLKGALRAYTEPVPSDFADKVLKQARALDEQKILAKVVLQERLALAVCILIPGAAAAAVFAYPQILTTAWAGLKSMFSGIPQIPAATWAGLKSIFYGIAKQVALRPHYGWQFGAILVAAIGFAGYRVFDLLFADR